MAGRRQERGIDQRVLRGHASGAACAHGTGAARMGRGPRVSAGSGGRHHVVARAGPPRVVRSTRHRALRAAGDLACAGAAAGIPETHGAQPEAGSILRAAVADPRAPDGRAAVARRAPADPDLMPRPFLTVLTAPVPTSRQRIRKALRGRARAILKPRVPLPASSPYPGHYALVRSVVEGLRAIGADFNFNPRRVSELARIVYAPA